jgi:hypothetical protein
VRTEDDLRFLVSDLHPPITNLEHQSALKMVSMLQKDLPDRRSAITNR